MTSPDKMKILLSKVGLDGHDRGIKVLSQMFRDAGAEVIYLGRYQTAENIAAAALQEDVDVVGLSFLSGEHLFFTRRVLDQLKEKGVGCGLIVGGTIPAADVPVLKEMGAEEVFRPGSKVEDIIRFVEEKVTARRQRQTKT